MTEHELCALLPEGALEKARAERVAVEKEWAAIQNRRNTLSYAEVQELTPEVELLAQRSEQAYFIVDLHQKAMAVLDERVAEMRQWVQNFIQALKKINQLMCSVDGDAESFESQAKEMMDLEASWLEKLTEIERIRDFSKNHQTLLSFRKHAEETYEDFEKAAVEIWFYWAEKTMGVEESRSQSDAC